MKEYNWVEGLGRTTLGRVLMDSLSEQVLFEMRLESWDGSSHAKAKGRTSSCERNKGISSSFGKSSGFSRKERKHEWLKSRRWNWRGSPGPEHAWTLWILVRSLNYFHSALGKRVLSGETMQFDLPFKKILMAEWKINWVCEEQRLKEGDYCSLEAIIEKNSSNRVDLN